MNAYKQPIAIVVMLFSTAAALAFYRSNIPAQSETPSAILPIKEITSNNSSSLKPNIDDIIIDASKVPEQAPMIRSPKASLELNTKQTQSQAPQTNASKHDVLPIQDPNSDNLELPGDIAQLDERFNTEGYDVQWAAQVESETWDEFYRAQLSSSEIEAVDCRTTVCKITVTHENEDAAQQFHNQLLRSINGRNGKIHNHVDEHGLRITTVYRYR